MNETVYKNKAEYIAEIQRLFDVLRDGSAADIKLAKKVLYKVVPANRAYTHAGWGVASKVIAKIPGVTSGMHRAAMVSGMDIFALYFHDVHFSELSDFIIQCSEDSDGRVRQAGRTVSHWFRGSKELQTFLQALEKKIREYEPPSNERPSHIGDIPPSVYKSLVLMWHDFHWDDYGEKRPELMDYSHEDFIPFYGESDYVDDDEEYEEDEDEEGFIESPYFENEESMSIDDLYYKALEMIGGPKKYIRQGLNFLERALSMGTNNIQTYVGFVSIYRSEGDTKTAGKYILLGYDEVLKKHPKWPLQMWWAHIESRATLRMIQYRAEQYFDEGDTTNAEKLYRLLLKLNPNDNQGVRYVLAGMFAGISGEDVNALFDEGSQKQDWSALEKLVHDQNKKHHFWDEPMDE